MASGRCRSCGSVHVVREKCERCSIPLVFEGLVTKESLQAHSDAFYYYRYLMGMRGKNRPANIRKNIGQNIVLSEGEKKLLLKLLNKAG